MRFTYDAFGRAATVAMDGGPTTTYTYYPNGMLNTVAWSPVSGVFKYRYTPTQEIASITYPNGQVRAFTYDDIGRITSVSTTHPTAGPPASYDYQWDVDPSTGATTMIGQISAIVANVPALSLVNAATKYYYDGAYRLRRADYPTGAPFNGRTDSWLYDAIGNRTSATVGGTAFPYTYLHSIDQNGGTSPLNNQQLQSDGTNSYTYDNNGNLITRAGGSALSLSWDFEDRLAGLTGSVTASYVYDAYGRRTSKTVEGTSTAYVYAGDNLLRESTPSSTADFLFTPRLDDVLAMQRDGTVYYYTGDGANSVTLLSDAGGTVADTYVYDAWGKTAQSSGTVANPFGYTGREMGEGGLLYYRARYYDPGTGRFTAVDPINLLAIFAYSKGKEPQPFAGAEYSYADNSPLIHGDPLGLQCMINTPAPPSIFHPQPQPSSAGDALHPALGSTHRLGPSAQAAGAPTLETGRSESPGPRSPRPALGFRAIRGIGIRMIPATTRRRGASSRWNRRHRTSLIPIRTTMRSCLGFCRPVRSVRSPAEWMPANENGGREAPVFLRGDRSAVTASASDT